MHTKELLETLSNCKFYRNYAKKEFENKIQTLKKEINWEQRIMTKNRIFKKYLITICGLFAFIVLFFIIPLLIACPSYGKAAMLGISPMFIMILSWMAGAWWAWDKPRHVFFCVTMGAVPIRLAFCLMWGVIVFTIPDVSQECFFVSMMGFWMLFTTVEIAMIQEMSNKIESISETK